jgi:transcription antitermination protein NusB
VGARTTAREAALLALFAAEAEPGGLTAAARLPGIFRDFAAEAKLVPEVETHSYALEIAVGVETDREAIDELIRRSSQNWRLERMSRIDRNILRIGAWELRAGVARAITIDEAVELAKRYGTAESGSFVNGLLDRIAEELGAA